MIEVNKLVMVSFCSVLMSVNAGDWEDALAKLTDEVSEPITNGFFFWEGEYVSPPYYVSRKGVGIYINGHYYRDFASNPFPEEPRGEYAGPETMPSVPTNISSTTDIRAPECWGYIKSAYAYLLHEGRSKLTENLAAAVRLLPNVGQVDVANGLGIAIHPKDNGETVPFKFHPDASLSWRLGNLIRCANDTLNDRGHEELESVADGFRSGVLEYLSHDVRISGSGRTFREDFRTFLSLADENVSDAEIRARNKNEYGKEIWPPAMLDEVLLHRESLSEEFRRRMFGEYWQTYGVKPETEEERVERIFRDVSYHQRTTDDLLKRLDGMVYNITVRHHGDTNKFTEADIDEIDHSRRRYEESLVERDAYWATLSEEDKALMTVKLAQKKADEEAEKNAAILKQRTAAMTNRIAKYERKFRETLTADPDCSSLDEEVLGKICLTKAKAVNVLWKAKDCAGGNDAGKQTIPDSIDELIASTYKGVAVLVGGEDSAKDAWGTIFRYSVMGKEHDVITITSAGPDKRFGTADDIITTEDDW